MHVFISSKESVTAKVRINDICRLNVSLELGCTPDMGILCSEQFILYINYSVSCTIEADTISQVVCQIGFFIPQLEAEYY